MPSRPPVRLVDPNARRGPFYRAYARLAGSRAGARFSRLVLWRLDPRLLQRTRGRVSMARPVPTVLLETSGARTGLPRRHGVIYFNDPGGDDVIVVASHMGLPTHPAWYHNAVAHPDVLLNGAPYRAEVVADDAERDRLWRLADQVFPPFATYRERAGAAGRVIPLLRLRPAG